jgi:zinc protease
MTDGRGKAPEAGPVRAFEVPEVRSLRVSNGLTLRVARQPRLPLVSAVLVLPSGESSLEHALAGLAVLAADALDGGTALHSAAELAAELESIGAPIHAGAGWDATTIGFTCLAERLPRALELLAEVIQSSTFPEEEVSRTRGQQMARLRQRAMDPASLANDSAARLIHPEEAPYSRPLTGTLSSVSAATSDALRGFAASHYRPGEGGLVLVGDVDIEAAAALAEACLRPSPPTRRRTSTPRARPR